MCIRDRQEMTMSADGMNLVVHLEDGTMKLLDTNLQLNMGGLQLSAFVTPSATRHAFPQIDATYESMLPLMEYILSLIHICNNGVKYVRDYKKITSKCIVSKNESKTFR